MRRRQLTEEDTCRSVLCVVAIYKRVVANDGENETMKSQMCVKILTTSRATRVLFFLVFLQIFWFLLDTFPLCEHL